MKGIPYVINFTDPSLPDKERFVIRPKTTDGPEHPTSDELDSLADEQHTSLILAGMGVIEFGERVDNDLVWLLEHFAGKEAPVNPTAGQTWFDYNSKTAKVWNGTAWVPMGGDKHIASYLDFNRLVELINDALSRPAIDKPVNITPAANATNVDINTLFRGSEYHSRYSTPQAAAQWQASTSSSFAAPLVFDRVKTGESVTLTYEPGLTANTSYFWRVRYKDTQGAWSEWSDATTFKTAQATLLTPSIVLPTNGSIGQALDLNISSSTIAASSGSDTLDEATWEIYTAPNQGGTRVYAQSTLGYILSVPSGMLQMGETYYVRVRLKGTTLGLSPWSADSSFATVQPTVLAPTIDVPTSNSQTTLTPQFIGSSFVVSGGTDTLESSKWEIYSGSDGSGSLIVAQTSTGSKQFTVASGTLELGKSYSARLRYVGVRWGNSPWSAYTNFRVESIAAGTVLSYYCSGTTRMAIVADGNGGTTNQVIQTNSSQCGYVPPNNPPAGTILATHCVGVDKYNTVANGSGGSTEQLVETNSASCGYVPPVVHPPAGTLISSRCSGFDKYNTVANGSGGSYEVLAETNSAYCGYVPPQPYADIGTLTQNNNNNVYNKIPVSGTATAMLTFKSDGNWASSSTGTLGPINKSGKFLYNGANPNDFEIKFALDREEYFPSFEYAARAGTFNTWLPLTQDQYIALSGYNSDSYAWVNYTVSVRKKSTGEVVSTSGQIMIDRSTLNSG